MGARVEFGDGGPRLPEPLRDASGVARLHRFDPASAIPFTGEILSRLAREVGDRAAVLGFCGAPWTLATYLVEGGDVQELRRHQADDGPRPRHCSRGLLDLLADVAADVLSFQIASGARAVQLFDTWAGELSAEDYREWALPAAARAIARDPPPRRRARHPLRQRLRAPRSKRWRRSGADVLSIDWRLPLAEARRRAAGEGAAGQPRSGAPARGRRRRSRAARARCSPRPKAAATS